MSTPDAVARRRLLPEQLAGSRIQLQEYALVGVVLLLVLAGAVLESDDFLTSDNLLNVLRQASIVGVLAIGMTFVIATAGIDLSVGSMVAAAAIAGGQFVDSGSFVFFLAALGMGILLGGINGGAIAYGRVPPFMATLAMLLAARGIALWMSDKTPISIFNLEGIRWFGNGEVLGIPSSAVVFLAITAIGWSC
jgi:ribose/xylose/arabinose/galactoside ABC-type transport system permease subunit